MPQIEPVLVVSIGDEETLDGGQRIQLIRKIGHRRETWPSSWERDPQLATTKQHFPFSSALVSNAGQRHVDVGPSPTALRNVSFEFLRYFLQKQDIVSTQLPFILGQQAFSEVQ